MSVSVHPCTKLFIFLSYGYHAKAKALYLKPLFINENFSFSLLRTGNWCFFWPVLWIQIHRSWSRILAQFGSGSRVILSILEEKIQNNFRENNFKYRYIFLNYNTKLSPKIFFNQLSLWIVNWYLKSDIFCLHFSYICMCGSGSMKLLSWIRIRICNTGLFSIESFIKNF